MTSGMWNDAHILVVDDEPANVTLLSRVLRQAGYTSVATTTDSRKVMALCMEQPPDIVLLDLMMPHLDGYAVLEQLRLRNEPGNYLPILILTADASPIAKQKALSSGANDFLVKPLDHAEVLLRVHNLLETRHLYERLNRQNNQLEERVRERTRELQQANERLESFNAALKMSKNEIESSQSEVLDRLARAAEFRDDDTGQHTYRVGEMAALLALALGWTDNDAALMRRAAPLHDVGKIGIPDGILLKPGKLTEEEFDVMKKHTIIGAALLKDGHSALVQLAHSIALNHHERWDGAGYPRGLHGEDIPQEGRILAVVDVFDALTNSRPYKKAWEIGAALTEIESQACKQFDPIVVAAFLGMAPTLTVIESRRHFDQPLDL